MSYGKPDSINGIASLQPYKITEKISLGTV